MYIVGRITKHYTDKGVNHANEGNMHYRFRYQFSGDSEVYPTKKEAKVAAEKLAAEYPLEAVTIFIDYQEVTFVHDNLGESNGSEYLKHLKK